MSIKLSTYKTEEKKVLEEQYEFNVVDDINIGLLHQVSKANRTNHRNNTASVKTRQKYREQALSRGLKKEQEEQDKVH